MNIDIDTLFKTEAFVKLGPERLRLFRQFTAEIDGKKTPEIAASYIKLNQQISKAQPLTQEERGAIMKTIYDSLPDAERQKFTQMLKILRVH